MCYVFGVIVYFDNVVLLVAALTHFQDEIGYQNIKVDNWYDGKSEIMSHKLTLDYYRCNV